MTDHNLPPERRLDESTKAQMRAELVETSAREDSTTKRSWLVPALAAAAMAGVAALGAGLALGGNDGTGSTEEIAPAGSGSGSGAGSGSADEPTTTKSEETVEITLGPLPDELELDGPVSCADEVGTVLSAARLDAELTYAEGSAALWRGKGTWVLCDDWAAITDGGAPTLIGNRAGNDPTQKHTYAISENYAMADDHVAQFVAGGPRLPEVESISYTFPDGHTEDAVIKKDMWLMAYVPTSGSLVDAEPETEPIHVEVTMTGGATTSYDLEWGFDTCAQINHGC